ncbi:MAG: hypothetical protein K9H18_19530 [Rhodospirillum sp.]|nr:hypothetical protein [Rhodospirillum sp.]MCF8500187.1 hypothetical protein [Rhodospirillum sp.]
MAKFVRIISRKDGFRRGGMAHFGKAEHPVDTFTEAQLDALLAEAGKPGGTLFVEVVEKDDRPPDDLIAAIGKLDRANPAHFTKGGKPETKALEDVVERQVTATERDAAWDAFQARAKE